MQAKRRRRRAAKRRAGLSAGTDSTHDAKPTCNIKTWRCNAFFFSLLRHGVCLSGGQHADTAAVCQGQSQGHTERERAINVREQAGCDELYRCARQTTGYLLEAAASGLQEDAQSSTLHRTTDAQHDDDIGQRENTQG